MPDRHDGGNAFTPKSNASSAPPTAGSARPRCTAPLSGTPPHPLAAATTATTATTTTRRQSDTGRLPPGHRARRRYVGPLVGIERQRRLSDVGTRPPRQREPEHRAA